MNAVRYFDSTTQRIKVSHNFKFPTPSPPDPVATVPLAPEGELDGSGGDPSDERPLEMPDMGIAPIMPPSAPMTTKNDALEEPALRHLDQARTNHDYHWMANPNARRPGARHKANTAKLNREAFTATIFHVLHGEMNLNEAPQIYY